MKAPATRLGRLRKRLGDQRKKAIKDFEKK